MEQYYSVPSTTISQGNGGGGSEGGELFNNSRRVVTMEMPPSNEQSTSHRPRKCVESRLRPTGPILVESWFAHRGATAATIMTTTRSDETAAEKWPYGGQVLMSVQ